MDGAIKTYNHEHFGKIRTVTIDGVIYFVGKDVAEALGYTNPRDALAKHVDDEDKNTVAFRDGIQGNPNMTVINESGLYSLILSSRLPDAKKFKRWVTAEVLPSIRKTGTYSAKQETPPVSPLTALEQTLAVLKHHEARIKAVESEQQQQRSMLAWLNPIEGETQRQTLNRLIKEYAATLPNFDENKPAAYRQAWYDFINNIDTDQHIKIMWRAKNRKCKPIDILEQDNLLTQGVSIISNMLVKVKKKISAW